MFSGMTHFTLSNTRQFYSSREKFYVSFYLETKMSIACYYLDLRVSAM